MASPQRSETDGWVRVVAIGYDANGKKTGETGIYLCKGPDNIVMDWTKWDLSVLGKVHKVAFNVTGSSDNGYGFSQPAYFAYDDVAVRFEKPVSATGIKISSSKLELVCRRDRFADRDADTGEYDRSCCVDKLKR